MTQNIHSLERILEENLPWNQARIKFLARCLIALFAARTVNLSRLANVFPGRAKEESNYKRLQRFFRGFSFSYAQLSRFVVKLLGVPGPWTLALDRTNWKIGALEVNFLVLSLIWRGIGFPVVWLVLPHAGNSDTTERIQLLDIFRDLFGGENIECLLGDREFVGQVWFAYLKQHRIRFQMRIKRDTQVRNRQGQLVPAYRLFASTRINQMRVIESARQMWGLELFLSGCRLRDGEYLILVSAHYNAEPAAEYKKRWGIETLFGALKSRGFNLEDTKLKDPERLSSLLAVLAIAFTIAFVIGEWQAEVKGLKLTKQGYARKSVFRLGIDMLCRLLTNFEYFDVVAWKRVIKLLSC